MRKIKLYIFILSLILPYHLKSQQVYEVVALNLMKQIDDFTKIDNIPTAYTLIEVSKEKIIKVKLSTQDKLFSDTFMIKITKAPKTIYESTKNIKYEFSNNDLIRKKKQTSFEEELQKLENDDLSFQFKDDEELEAWIDLIRKDTIVEKRWHIQFKQENKNDDLLINPNFLYVAAIKSIAGQKPSSEFLEVLVKFNYGTDYHRRKWIFGKKNKKIWKIRSFSMLSADLVLSEDSTRRFISEAMFNANLILTPTERIENRNVDRVFFLGGGAKIFNNYNYVGLHIGSLEINKHFFSSYVMGGYYANPFATYVRNDYVDKPRFYQHNLYFETAFCAKRANIGILSNLRVKIGVLVPLAYKEDAIATEKDIQTRIAIQIPIGGIFKF